MTHEQLKRQVIDFIDKYKGQNISLEVEAGTVEIVDDEGFSKYGHNGTATFTIRVNGGASHEMEY